MLQRAPLYVALGAMILLFLCFARERFTVFEDDSSLRLSHDHSYDDSPEKTSNPAQLDHDALKDGTPSQSSKLTVSDIFPSKVWQSWKDDSEDPTERTKGFPRTWRTLNPEWDYERITDDAMDDFVTTRFDAPVSTTFTNLTDPILKADFLRYLILLHEGGVWADIDVLPHQPINSWIPQSHLKTANLIIGIENDHHKKPIWPKSPYSVQLCQYTVLSKPNHPAIKTLVDQVTAGLEKLLAGKRPGQAVTFAEVMGTTGPFAFTKALMEYFTAETGVEHTGDELDSLEEPRMIGDVLVLPKDSFGWLPQEPTHEKGDPMILVEHLFIGSWRDGHPG